MTAPIGTGLARVTVSTPKRRIDVALPADLAVGLLLVSLLPVTCLLTGFYPYVRGLFASLGG